MRVLSRSSTPRVQGVAAQCHLAAKNHLCRGCIGHWVQSGQPFGLSCIASFFADRKNLRCRDSNCLERCEQAGCISGGGGSAQAPMKTLCHLYFTYRSSETCRHAICGVFMLTQLICIGFTSPPGLRRQVPRGLLG